MGIRKEKEKLRLSDSFLHHSSDAVFIIDPLIGRFTDVNEKACSSLGYKREELMNMGGVEF